MKYFEKDAHDSRPYYENRKHGLIRSDFKKTYKKIIWPINAGLYDIDDKNIKRELCVVVTNIPVYWTKDDILWFFREYFYKLAIDKNIQFPLIEHVYLIKNDKLAVLACHDGSSKETIESLSTCKLKSGKDKKKIVLSIKPYQKKNDMENNERNKNSEKEYTYDTDDNSDKEKQSDEENKSNSKIMTRSLTPPKNNGIEWPNDTDLRSCKDMEVRKRLCVFGRNKPLDWGVKELSEFLTNYFDILKKEHSNFEIPQISDIWADKGTHLITLACKDEKSRYNILLIRACYLNEEDAKNNLKSSLRVWLQFEKWSSFRNTFNNKYKANNNIIKNYYNKYSYINERIIDKNNYKRKTFRKPTYDEFPRNKVNSFRNDINNQSMKLNNISNNNNYYYREDRGRKNYDNTHGSFSNNGHSGNFNKYKKRTSRSRSPQNYYNKKRFEKSQSMESRKRPFNNHWNKNNKPYNHHLGDKFNRKSSYFEK
ncbi:conserved Plasmodium protein, unknown function [Plasmodium berghei]|uniref:Uncharacterized protein n=2 Tax=Plasmodium berghei TaxID=5821 RepID=A0A509ARA4_PLABA|nr:conserved Plasmodium protein, unknown function [Plasmodium berghei ANKA]CXJ10757.1 conserved Plasmodium protein, unknown function [Plasmodium berghei]SCM25975.1 conserved Plasmodium protein, unknown function [Plasmodium berghei]SCN28210.1 conserved Plasmodium protein, unknown function [Plasmodium berghei]SCO62412.1 conserved Plasmodium protein, unknown function [Plasmodium berghei]SCO63970.1 conserved Plasmodium protein, unknown function [Plasmodium berghei]|eukprot:XP_034423866.1 conserved Plasmodium protein, unknown function [Plasmodium berghei ANKA]